MAVSRHPLPWVVRLAGGWAWPVGVAAEGGSDAVTWRIGVIGVTSYKENQGEIGPPILYPGSRHGGIEKVKRYLKL